jgi:hypothetical protein
MKKFDLTTMVPQVKLFLFVSHAKNIIFNIKCNTLVVMLDIFNMFYKKVASGIYMIVMDAILVSVCASCVASSGNF